MKRRVAAIVSSEPAEAVTAEEVEPGGAHPIEQLLEPSPAEPKSTAAALRRRPAFFKWMVIGVVAALVLGGGLTALLLTRDGGPYEYGDDTRLDWLWDRCDAGDMESCDAMTAEADSGTDYFFFGETCGERVVGGGDCAGRGIDDEGSFGYGDDPGLDELWDACNAGTMVACDELAAEAPPDSEYAAFGHTCGERTDGGGECASRGEASISLTYGDDPFFDELWDRCNAEDFTACSELFELAPPETEYERFGGSCGGRTEFPQGCGPLLIEGGELDALAEACAAGDMEGCWMLYELSPLGSEYEEFGLTCGGRTDGSMPCVFTYGDSRYLDEMWDGCAEGNMEMCDLLYVESPVDSEYEDFGWTCGWRTDGGEDCAGG